MSSSGQKTVELMTPSAGMKMILNYGVKGLSPKERKNWEKKSVI